MTALEVAAILFPLFIGLVILRVPVAFALGLSCVPVFILDERLTPFLLMNEMFKSYNAFILLAVPFFLLAANIMNAAGITDRLVLLSRAMVGHLPGGLGHVNVVVSMLFAGISGSSTADAAGIGSLMIPQMKKQGFATSFTVAITACSSVMGVIIPPSILMVVWGGLMTVSIGGLFLAGVIPGDAVMNERPRGRGYMQIEETGRSLWPLETDADDGAPARFTAHEFHYASLENLPGDLTYAYRVLRGVGMAGRHDGIVIGNLTASFMHLRDVESNHWVDRFVTFVRARKRVRSSGAADVAAQT